MSGSHRAATLAYANQSTVIRRANSVLSIFGGDIDRSSDGWRVSGVSEPLRMERWIHQHFRLRGRKPMRLHAPFWSSASLRDREIPNWIFNPPSETNLCENPLELLKERIIDGCLLSPPQVEQLSPVQAGDLVMVPLYDCSIDLVMWPWLAASEGSQESARSLSLRCRSSRFQLYLFPFLPQPCRAKSQAFFETISDQPLESLATKAGNETEFYRAAFLTSEMHRHLRRPHVVDDSMPCPYTETLVFLAEHASEPSMHQLVDSLLDHFSAIPSRS
jgi:hypothetical protein